MNPRPAESKASGSEESRKPSPAPLVVVGVGASSGGLEAFKQFLKPIGPEPGLAFVLIQHLDARQPSSLAEILQSATILNVQEARDGTVVQPNHIYIIPATSDLTISNGALKLEPRTGKSSSHLPIDRFFHSLAVDRGRFAVGVVLSGSGSDGTQGLLSIREAGGITFAQEESSAEFGGMPHSAITAGAVDFVLKASEMGAELVRVETQSRTPLDVGEQDELDLRTDEKDLKRIFALLEKATKIDFAQYKRKTVDRRIARRMVVNKLSSVADYATYLDSNPAEISTLFREILINVTSFFREPASFDRLMTIWREKVRDFLPGQSMRVWVAACATGEEAYSLAICLMELFGERDFGSPIQIFGTDINEAALETARAGIYPDTIVSEIPPERLTRFFVKVDRGYQISKAIRECCIFARHDLIRDPPFSRLDLVSCRNVLIYMSPLLQRRIVPMFHYSLKTGGILMLGSAEALSGHSDLFDVLDRQYKLFVRRPGPVHFTPDFNLAKRHEESVAPNHPLEVADLEAMALRTIRDRFAPDGFVINRELRIVLFRGQTSFYLEPAAGNPSFHLMRMITDDLAFKLEAMVARSSLHNTAVRETNVTIKRDERTRTINIEVIPLQPAEAPEPYYLIAFETVAENSAAERVQPTSELDGRIPDYERELAEARTRLRAMAEEHEVHVEELRAANEEVRSTNEELQSTNEELGAAKEELQSTNEELSTVNQELSTKNSSLAALNDDLKNLFNAANLPILMVDGSYRLRRFTPAAESFLNLLSADIGRTITDLRLTVDIPQFKQLLDSTIRDLTISSLTVMAANNRWYTVSIRPYRTLDNRIDGAVITFTDIDSLKRSLSEAQDARQYAESILDTLWEPLLVLDSQMRVQRATAGFYRAFQVAKEETEGRSFYELGNKQWDIPRLRVLLEDILPRNTSFEDFEVEHSFPKIGFRSMRLNGRRIRRQGDGGEAILIAIDDVTERRETAEVRYQRLFETAKDGILELDGDSGDILAVNPYFQQICNCSRNELIGKKMWETGLFEPTPQLRNLVSETQRRDTVRFDSLGIRGKDGRRFETEMICNRYLAGEESVIQCNIRDVTERKLAEDELRRSNEDLQQFAYAASHDLQEPLRMVGAFTQLLSKKFQPIVDEEGGKYLAVIRSSVSRMEQLIKDLLIYSQTTGYESRPISVNAERVLGMTIANLQLAISDTGAIITNDPLPTIRVDHIQFAQVFQNLVSNAIKYRKPDQVPRIHVSADRRGSEWVFSVSDEGLGFDDRYAEQIFGVFKRLHGKDYPGTGIGLSICKKIIERRGGRIWAKSVVGEGATFFFTIPDGDNER